MIVKFPGTAKKHSWLLINARMINVIAIHIHSLSLSTLWQKDTPAWFECLKHLNGGSKERGRSVASFLGCISRMVAHARWKQCGIYLVWFGNINMSLQSMYLSLVVVHMPFCLLAILPWYCSVNTSLHAIHNINNIKFTNILLLAARSRFVDLIGLGGNLVSHEVVPACLCDGIPAPELLACSKSILTLKVCFTRPVTSW